MEIDRFVELEEEMDKAGLIPEAGDSEYFWPAMVLRVSRLLYERENNGNINYNMEDECEGFYHEFERELNRFGRKYGLGELGTIIIHGREEEVEEALNRFVELVKAKKKEWTAFKWIPTY
jgi:hypothetical protein